MLLRKKRIDKSIRFRFFREFLKISPKIFISPYVFQGINLVENVLLKRKCFSMLMEFSFALVKTCLQHFVINTK
jgi:hypothetical protein